VDAKTGFAGTNANVTRNVINNNIDKIVLRITTSNEWMVCIEYPLYNLYCTGIKA
jgi:hypothetical protein